MAGSVKGIELLVISKRESTKKPGSGWKIRVVQWVKDGASLSVKLECGEYWTDEATNEERFKAKGFSKKDLDACKPKWGEIIGFMNNPPPVASPLTSDDADPGF